jgi:hypothetical protein
MTIWAPDTLNAAFLAILTTSLATASVAVRAALGAGAASIIVQDDLDPLALPARPFLVLGSWVLTGTPGWDMQRIYPTWYIYDDPIEKFKRIDALVGLIAAAYPYDEPDLIPGADVRRASSLPKGFYDSKVGGRPARSLPYQVSWR